MEPDAIAIYETSGTRQQPHSVLSAEKLFLYTEIGLPDESFTNLE